MFRQGDILLVAINKIPRKARKQKDRILALGETSGHKHQLSDGEVYRKDGDKYVELLQPALLVHEEHGKIDLPKGNYKVVRQREYRPAKRRAQTVVD